MIGRNRTALCRVQSHMDIDTELRVIAELRALAHLYGWQPGAERADELLDELLTRHKEHANDGPDPNR